MYIWCPGNLVGRTDQYITESEIRKVSVFDRTQNLLCKGSVVDGDGH